MNPRDIRRNDTLFAHVRAVRVRYNMLLFYFGLTLMVLLSALVSQLDQPRPPALLKALTPVFVCTFWLGVSAGIACFSAVNTFASMYKSVARGLFWFIVCTAVLVFVYRTALIKGPQSAFISAVVSLSENAIIFFLALWMYEEPVDDILLRPGESMEQEIENKFELVVEISAAIGVLGLIAVQLLA